MFYYREHSPDEGTVVITQIVTDQETEHCMYVTLPEFNNISGIIQKSELPKRRRTRENIISKLRKSRYIPCIVSNKPLVNTLGESNLIELGMRGVSKEFTDDIIKRYKNIEKIIKIIKFISIEFKIEYRELVRGFHDKLIIPLAYIDDEKGIDDFSELYSRYLTDCNSFVALLGTDSKTSIAINVKLNDMINEVESVSTLDFDLAIWKSKNKDAVFVIRDLFKYLKNVRPDIELQYIGAPTYKILLSETKANLIDSVYCEIRKLINQWMTDNNVSGYGLSLDPENKKTKKGDISISYPYKIEIVDK